MYELLFALDVKTLIFVLVVGYSFAVILLILDIRSGSGLFDKVFVFGLIFQALGWALIDMRGLIPTILSFSIGNSLQFMGMAFEGIGLLSLKREFSRPWLAAYAAALALTLAFWWFPGFSQPLRIFLISLPYPFFLGAPGWVFLDPRSKSHTPLPRFLGIVLLAYSAGMLARGFILLNQANYSLAEQTLIQVIVLVLFVLVMILGSTGYILIRKEQAGERLAKANESLARANEGLAHASEEKNLLLLELRHRVKNSLAIIASLASLEGERHDEEFRQSMDKVRDRINAVAKLYELLIDADPTKGVRLDLYIRDIAQRLMGSYSATPERVRLELSLEPIVLDAKASISVGLIVNELATNAMKHAFPEGRSGTLSLDLARKGERIELVVADDGVGLPEGWTEDKAKGLGTLLVSTLAKQVAGSLSRAEGGGKGGKGTLVRIEFPEPSSTP
jgi:two-component sensor histidine kinase